jgi:hypothetical protein
MSFRRVFAIAGALLLSFPLGSGAQSTPVAAGCSVPPRPLSELTALAATPVAASTPGVSLTIGEPLNIEQYGLIEQTMEQFIACSNAGEPLRVYGLYTDRYLQQLLSLERPAIDQARYDQLATPIPAAPGEGAHLIEIAKQRKLLDTRLYAEVTITYPSVPVPKTFVVLFVQTTDGLLIDDIMGELTFSLP